MASLMKHINVVARCAAEYRNEELSGVGLCGLQYLYILNVCREPGINQEELSHKLHVNKSNVTRQLAALEDNGFIERKQSPADKRVTCVYPTERATDALPEIHRVLHAWKQYLTDGFTEEERETLARLMEKIADRAVDYIENGGKIENE